MQDPGAVAGPSPHHGPKSAGCNRDDGSRGFVPKLSDGMEGCASFGPYNFDVRRADRRKSRRVMLRQSARGQRCRVGAGHDEVDMTKTMTHREAVIVERLFVCRERILARRLWKVSLALVVACRLPRKKDRRWEAWVYGYRGDGAGLRRPCERGMQTGYRRPATRLLSSACMLMEGVDVRDACRRRRSLRVCPHSSALV